MDLRSQSHPVLPGLPRAIRAAVLAAGVVLTTLATARAAAALVACSAADVAAQDGGCPTSATVPCNITKIFTVAGGCVLDFGGRDVTILASGQFDVAPGEITIRARNLTLAPGGLIEGRGEDT